MELLVCLGLLVALAAAALRWGYDSREVLPSKERELARFGVTLDGLPRPTIARRLRSVRASTRRPRLATIASADGRRTADTELLTVRS